jgi:hypothetical protein
LTKKKGGITMLLIDWVLLTAFLTLLACFRIGFTCLITGRGKIGYTLFAVSGITWIITCTIWASYWLG